MTSRNKTVGVIIIARNEEEMIGDCLACVSWADEVLVLDTGSTDRTVAIAKKAGVRVVALSFAGFAFASWRNRALKEVKTDWIFYLDADERVTPLLKNEILETVKKDPGDKDPVAFFIPRRNFYLGREMKHGGAWPDYVKRLFWAKAFDRWQGELHEEPIFKGGTKKLVEPLIHLTHRNLTSMLAKSVEWTKIEAKLIVEAGHPSIVWWRVLRMMGTKFWERVVWQGAWKDGTEGWLNAIFEVFNTFMIYARVWEMHQKEKDNEK
ncbi:glycosyltransferase family 2 protein [Patescibacteria group bacterium]|nr:glycosyltransferase family 2 protein [Patescibacteria group bacterium]